VARGPRAVSVPTGTPKQMEEMSSDTLRRILMTVKWGVGRVGSASLGASMEAASLYLMPVSPRPIPPRARRSTVGWSAG